MEISSMQAFNEPKSEYAYLNSAELIEGNRYKRVAFATNVNYGNDKRDMGYFSFYLKTTDNMILSAPLFNVNNFIEKGFSATALTGKPVLVDFIAQHFRGRWSLILSSITIWEGNFDKSKFINKLDIDTSDIVEALGVCSKYNLNAQIELWKFSSFESLAGNNIGAFALLAKMVINRLKPYANLWDMKLDELYAVAIETLNVLFKVYSIKENYPKIRDEQALDILNDLRAKWRNEHLKDAILNAANSILFECEPDQLYASITLDSIREALRDIRTVYLFRSVPTGGSLNIENRKLVKY